MFLRKKDQRTNEKTRRNPGQKEVMKNLSFNTMFGSDFFD